MKCRSLLLPLALTKLTTRVLRLDVSNAYGTFRAALARFPPEKHLMRLTNAFIVANFAFVISGCTVSSGLNKPCNLPKLVMINDAGVVVPITEGEVQENLGTSSGATRDFVAFGAVDCEDLVCVRDSSFPKGTVLTEPAIGYCSRPCAQGLACPSDDPALDERGDTRMSCRPLLLTKEALKALAEAGRGFGVQEPYFCARGGLGDGGVAK